MAPPSATANSFVVAEHHVGRNNVVLNRFDDGQLMLCFGTERFFKIRAFPAEAEAEALEAYQQTMALIAYAVIQGADAMNSLLNDSCWENVRLEFDVSFSKD